MTGPAIYFSFCAQRQLRGDFNVLRRLYKYGVPVVFSDQMAGILDIAVMTAIAYCLGAYDSLCVFHQDIAGLKLHQ
jgi:hypothetical protein